MLAYSPPPAVPVTVDRSTTVARLLLVHVVNLLIIGLLFMTNGGLVGWGSTGQTLLQLGRIAGLLGMYFSLVQLVLVARIPWLDRSVGMDRLTRWHRVNGHGALYLILAHVGLITVGYATKFSHSVASEVRTILFSYPDMLLAVVSLLLFVGTVGMSIQIARRKVRYEVWHMLHLYTYLAIALALPHQLSTGHEFLHHPFAQIYWWWLFVTAFSIIGWFRFLVPLGRNLRHQFRVSRVVREAPDVVSIYITGRHLDALGAAAGQFFLWRFLTPGYWAQAHPYSLSAAPNGGYLRITVRNAGDHSSFVQQLRPGTRVYAEGPYGSFTDGHRVHAKALLVAAGVGITPIRSLFESMRGRPGDLTVVYRTTNVNDAVFLEELQGIAAARRATLHVVSGERGDFPQDAMPLSPRHLGDLVPDVRRRDVYVCGPDGFTQTVVDSAIRLGADRHAIHFERFAF